MIRYLGMTPITSCAADLGHRKEANYVSYADFVGGLCKSGEEILVTLTPNEAHQIHMLLGVVGEVGELVDALKKNVIYRKPLDRANTIEELGDVEFYLQGLRNGLDIPRDLVIANNMEKLMKRYPNGYTNKAAITRADKAAVSNDNGARLEESPSVGSISQ